MQQAGFHQANTLVEKVTMGVQESISQRDDQLLALLQNIPQLSPASTQSEDAEDLPPTQVAANVQQDTVQLEILKLLKDLRSDLTFTRRQSQSNNSQSSNS